MSAHATSGPLALPLQHLRDTLTSTRSALGDVDVPVGTMTTTRATTLTPGQMPHSGEDLKARHRVSVGLLTALTGGGVCLFNVHEPSLRAGALEIQPNRAAPPQGALRIGQCYPQRGTQWTVGTLGIPS